MSPRLVSSHMAAVYASTVKSLPASVAGYAKGNRAGAIITQQTRLQQQRDTA